MIAPNDTRNWQVSMDDPAAIVEGVDDIVQSINIILTTIPGRSRNDAAHTVFKIEGTVVGSAEQITITTII